MPRYCKCCELGKKIVKQIEADFIDGVNKNQLAKKYGVSYDSISFHLNNHLPMKIAKGAELQLNQDGFNLIEKIDELYDYTKTIFHRNFDKEKDGMALKALSQQRNTLELLAKISYALHQNKLLEIEQEKRELLDVNIPIERLTKKEQELYFQINRKLLGESVTIDISGYTDFEEVREVEKQNKPKKITRTKFPPDKPEPEQTEESTQEPEQDDQLKFRPIVEQPPPKSNHNRRAFDSIIRKWNQERPQYGSTEHPNIPFSAENKRF